MKYTVLIFALLLSSCVCDLDRLSDIENLESRTQTQNALIRTQTIKRFKHSTKASQKFVKTFCTDNEIMETHLFGKGLLYDLGPDRSDWNKLGGYYFKTFQPHGETVMIGFRSDVERGVMEYTFYYHGIEDKDKYREVGFYGGYVDEDNILSVPWDDNENASTYTKFYIQILSDTEIYLKLEDKDGNYIEDIVVFKEVRRNFSRSNLYHGGNRPAQDQITAVKAIY